ncbi:MAG: hypothetical protein JWM25_965 [Thermoleophilia bacterium]|nr:hypothetical protein [Thermoleophilia bacterium]MCZ4496382.1 hypothetical protein [Thermoleophilia bacterium]
MGAEDHDIVARVSRAGGSTSTGALAAHIARACGHVLVDARVIQQGYSYFAELGDEIPAFFNKRMSTGSTNVAITLQAGFDPDGANAGSGPFTSHEQAWGEDPFDGCRSTADARQIIEADDYHASLWLARITVGVELFDVEAIADPLFIARRPNEFRVICEELVGLGVLQGHSCPMCSCD